MNIPPLKINFYTMCKFLAKLFKKKPPKPIEVKGKDVLFSVAINNYPDYRNNLRGCLNDQLGMVRLFKDYDQILLKDNEATVKNVKYYLSEIAKDLEAGSRLVFHYSGHGTQVRDTSGDEEDVADEALYLYDGVLIDDEINKLLSSFQDGVRILVLLDSCFSGTATRSTRLSKIRSRGIGIGGSKKVKRISTPDNLKWTVISGSREDQTSADAYIDGQYHGAFSFFLEHVSQSGWPVKTWYDALMKSPVRKFQDPTLEGVGVFDVFR